MEEHINDDVLMPDQTENVDVQTGDDHETDGRQIGEIEDQIVSLMKMGTTRWVDLYRMIAKVEKEKLYTPAYSSLTAWAARLAQRGGFVLRELWRYKKAGELYDAYARRQEAAGRTSKSLEEAAENKKAYVSPRSFETIRKIACGDHKKVDALITKLVNGKVNGAQLHQMWKTQREHGEARVLKSRHDSYVDASDAGDESASEIERHITAVDIVQALIAHNEWLPENPVHLPYISDRYRIFEEFPVYLPGTSSSGRIDALAVETIGSGRIDQVFLHGIEIKVDVNDLKNDKKMYQYQPFVDSFWIAVPEFLCDDALLYSSERLDGSAGVLVVKDDGIIEVAKTAEIKPGEMREKALEHLVYQLF